MGNPGIDRESLEQKRHFKMMGWGVERDEKAWYSTRTQRQRHQPEPKGKTGLRGLGGLEDCCLLHFCGSSGVRTQGFMHARETGVLLLSYTPAPEPAPEKDPPGNREAFRMTNPLAQRELAGPLRSSVIPQDFIVPVMELQN